MAKTFGPPGWTLRTGPLGVVAGVGILAAQHRGLKRAATVLQKEWKLLLSQRGHGKTYTFRFATIGGKVVPLTGASRPAHTASKPGEPPAKDSGILAGSIQIDDRGDRIRVGTNLRYGLALEYGVNVAGSRVGPHPDKNFILEPRPHARQALDAARDEMNDEMVKALR